MESNHGYIVLSACTSNLYLGALACARCLKFYGFDAYMSVLFVFNTLKLFVYSKKRDDLSALAHSSFYFKHFDLMNII